MCRCTGSLGFAAVLGPQWFALSLDIVPGLADKHSQTLGYTFRKSEDIVHV